jgi:hypothetical protein
MYENATMIFVDTFLRSGEEGIQENEEGDESN